MNVERFKEIIEDAGYETRSYSGRFMYGKSCIGFIVEDNELYAVANIVSNIEDEEERIDVTEIFRDVKTDSMGRDIIVYFPNLKYEEKEEEEED